MRSRHYVMSFTFALCLFLLLGLGVGWKWAFAAEGKSAAVSSTDRPTIKGGAKTTLEEWDTQIISEREAANALITSGDLIGGADALVQSLHALPSEYPELVDTAYGTVQLLFYCMEYLMDEPTRNQFVQQSLDPDENAIDHFVVAGYNIYIGQESAGKMQSAMDLMEATTSTHPLVRVGALFILSDPYFFGSTNFAQQNRDLLGQEYPDLAITAEAFRYGVYGVKKGSTEELEQAVSTVSKSGSKGKRGKHSEDIVIVTTAKAVDSRQGAKDSTTEADAVELYADAMQNAEDWHERFGLLLMIEPYAASGYEEQVKVTCLTLAMSKAETTIATPDVVRARTMLLKLARGHWDESPTKTQDPPPGYEWADTLLNTKWVEYPFERSLHEDVMKAIVNCAKQLGELGRIDLAVNLYTRLAERYPNSLVSHECQDAIAALQQL